ncbi:hypothetical protein [Streptomyces zaomyceticus]|uniref:hypothetical protein n=1 Tax=Streptomyces zaomyceticus TaxID=68286 RepID=UPI00378E97EA
MPQQQDARLNERLFGRGVAGFGGCVIWTGGLTQGGYGKIRAFGRHTTPHVAAYTLMVGPVPKGLELDHTCHTRDTSCPGGNACLHRRCFNPFHLEPVTGQVNTLRSPRTVTGENARREVCVNGHALTEENTHSRTDGHRRCKECRRLAYDAQVAAPARPPVREKCFQGHPFTEDNIYRRGAVITCRTCANASKAAWRERKRAERSGAPTCCGRAMRRDGTQWVCGKCRGWNDTGRAALVLVPALVEEVTV